MTPAVLERLLALRAAKQPVALLTRLSDGAQLLWPGEALPTILSNAAEAALLEDKARLCKEDGEAWFVHPHNPPLRLVVVGAVHIAQALVPMAAALGYGVTVVDPRRAFATEERFAGSVTLRTEWPDDALDALRPDMRTAVVTLTHDPKLDDPALDRALNSPAFYIGALGSRRTHAKRVARLKEMGHTEAAIARIRGPAGLPIEAVTAPEIALSILAEIVAVRRGAPMAGPGPGAAAAAPLAAHFAPMGQGA